MTQGKYALSQLLCLGRLFQYTIWEMQERNFMNPMSCDPNGSGIKYGRRRSTVKTFPWMKTVRRGRRRTKEFDERHTEWWEKALELQHGIKEK